MYSVLIAQPIAKEGIKKLEEAGFEVRYLTRYDPNKIKEEIADVDGLLVRNMKISCGVIKSGKKLKVISRHGVGMENIDIDVATERGIQITNTPIANSVTVAEHVMTMILALSKNLLIMDRNSRQGNFEIRHYLYGIELNGKTLSILGLGKIGSKLALMAKCGFGMQIICYDPYISPEKIDSAIKLTEDWKEVFKQADFVSINIPLNKKTRGIVGLKELRLMKPTAFLINCARAQIVDERELINALQEKRIAGAGIDVYAKDPTESHPLFKFDNVIMTPHSASHTKEAMNRMAVHAALGIIEVLNNKKPSWPVNQINYKN